MCHQSLRDGVTHRGTGRGTGCKFCYTVFAEYIGAVPGSTITPRHILNLISSQVALFLSPVSLTYLTTPHSSSNGLGKNQFATYTHSVTRRPQPTNHVPKVRNLESTDEVERSCNETAPLYLPT